MIVSATYVDTNVIIAFMDEKDPNHAKACELLRKEKRKITSFLTLIELSSVFSRAGLDDPQALAIYSAECAGVEIVDIKFERAMRLAFELSDRLKLRTLDLLHIVFAIEAGAKRILTFDREIIARKEEIGKLGSEVVDIV